MGEPCRFHHLRHSQASLGVALGVHPKLMAGRLGHASTRVTERYSHAYEGLDRQVAELLDGLRRQTLTEQGRNKGGVVRWCPVESRRDLGKWPWVTLTSGSSDGWALADLI